MTRILFVSLATWLALPALAGDPVTREDLHDEEADNTREQPRDRTVERDDLHDGDQQAERKGDVGQEEVRYENGRYIVTDDQRNGAKVEVTHDEKAVRSTASDSSRDVGDDLRKTAMDLVEGAARGLDRAEDTLDEAIDVSPEDRIEDVEDELKDPDVFRDED